MKNGNFNAAFKFHIASVETHLTDPYWSEGVTIGCWSWPWSLHSLKKPAWPDETLHLVEEDMLLLQEPSRLAVRKHYACFVHEAQCPVRKKLSQVLATCHVVIKISANSPLKPSLHNCFYNTSSQQEHLITPITTKSLSVHLLIKPLLSPL